jgi:outer membrane protein OmpA-like peptidoglycan-associated protein
MNMNKKWMTLILLILGAMIVSGCAISKETMMAYNEAKDLFQKATLLNAKKCAPCQYGRAEAYLALADEEVAEKDEHSGDLKLATKIVKEKSLEAIKLCEKPPTPPPPPPPPPPPLAPPVFDNIYFDAKKTNINPTGAKALDRNGMILKENPQINVVIEGHTNSEGSEKANQILSEKRALSVKKYLQDKFNISEKRMTTKGYGETRPIGDNKTNEGRAKNRRVEIRAVP